MVLYIKNLISLNLRIVIFLATNLTFLIWKKKLSLHSFIPLNTGWNFPTYNARLYLHVELSLQNELNIR